MQKSKLIVNSRFNKSFAWLLFILIFSVNSLIAQNRSVNGVVKDEKGIPLPGATVVQKGTTNGTVTNVDGAFNLKVPIQAQITISFVGLESQTISTEKKSNFEITLQPSAIGLDEVVAIGYGKQSRATITSAVTKVDDKELATTPSGNALLSVQGKVPGVDIRVTTGQPGSTPKVLIRGGTSPGNGTPLYVIDGVIRENMNDLNAEDIESMQVLKDGASASIYGARGAAGVIVISTKKGKNSNGFGNVNVKYGMTINQQARKYPFSNAQDYLWASRVAANQELDTNSKSRLTDPSYGYGTGNANYSGKQGSGYGNSVSTTEFYDELVSVNGQDYVNDLLTNQGFQTMVDPVTGQKLIFKDADYQNQMFRTGVINDMNVSFDGGNDKGTFYASFGALDNKGIVVGSNYKRYSAKFNGSYNIKENLKVNGGVDFQKSSKLGPGNSATDRSARMPHTIRLYTDEGLPSIGEGGGSPRNILHADYYQKRNESRYRTTLNFSLDWEILPGLNFKPRASYYKYEYIYDFFEKYNPYVTNRPMNATHNSYEQWTLDNILTYTKSIGKHNIDLLLGQSLRSENNFDMKGSGANAATDYVPTLNASATDDERVSSTIGNTKTLSYFGRLNYNFDEKYLLSASLRRDGSSRFTEQNKFALFPSVSGGWNMHKENFYKQSKVSNVLSSLKLRASYGTAGNDNVSLADTYGSFGTGMNYLGTTGVLQSKIGNQNLVWESTSTLDIGFDMGILNNKHTIYFDYYDKRTKDRLYGYNLPAQTGFNSLKDNIGIFQNKGIEIGVNTTLIQTNDFKWDMSVSFSLNKGYVLKLPNNGKENNRIGGREVWDEGSQSYKTVGGTAEGERIGQRWMWQAEGIYMTDDEAANAPYDTQVSGSKLGQDKHAGDVKWLDRDRNDTIDTRDLAFEGYASPDKIGSIISTVNYKGFTLRTVMRYGLGHIVANGWRARMNGNARNRMGTTDDVTNGNIFWAEGLEPYEGYDRTNAKYPRYNSGSDWDNGYRNHMRSSPIGNGAYDNDMYVSKGDYLSFSEVSLAYDFNANSRFMKTLRLKGLNLAAGVYNLGYITAFDGLTPEHYDGKEVGTYPNPLQFNFSARFTF
ncbi:SusC/RagA family TonB-linked outer membrane protein [Halosquirtibacter xylanolyticus]|uniref:SusC/RagA family TonB-linked outer membrane protein n=1 Tax=Halosquirtibacter xylanolyticus TaxID=3374599 RepID=UPI00374925F2|nr:SusC/RagA family TonB-linked outer membrane protein [Prolixibacteraceae bacterium]